MADTTAKILDFLNILEQRLAASFPWNIDSEQGKKQTAKVEKAVRRYLQSLYKKLPITRALALLRQAGVEEYGLPPGVKTFPNLREATVPKSVSVMLEDWAAEHADATAEQALAQAMIIAAQMGAKLALEDIMTIQGLGVLSELPVGLVDSTLKWAQKHSADLIKDINGKSANTLGSIIAQGLEHQDGVDGIRRSLEHFMDMEKERAEMIARTETNRAVSHGARVANEAVGADEKEWFTAGNPCDICAANADKGLISIKDSFPSDDQYPPAHPNCRCGVVYFGVDPDKLDGLV